MNLNSRKNFWKFVLDRPVVNFIMALLGLTAAYYTTIGSIKMQLAEKAETAIVEALDIELARLEVVIREGTVNKDQFFAFKNDIDNRLGRIEFYLSQNWREKP